MPLNRLKPINKHTGPMRESQRASAVALSTISFLPEPIRLTSRIRPRPCARIHWIFAIAAVFALSFSVMCFGQNCYDYANTTDHLKTKVTFNQKLHAKFFNAHKTSYPWYIIKNDDGTFESALDQEITKEDKIPIEHTSNCFSTHQGKHLMEFCDATYQSGILNLEIHGGLPAYASSLKVVVNDGAFSCFFKATYPALVVNCKWNILSKKLILKSPQIKKGSRIYAWISVVFEETSTEQKETTTKRYKIEGYLKPLVK